MGCFFSFPFSNYAKGHLEALILVKLFRRIDGGFRSAEGHRSNGLAPEAGEKMSLAAMQPQLSRERGRRAPQGMHGSGKKTSF